MHLLSLRALGKVLTTMAFVVFELLEVNSRLRSVNKGSSFFFPSLTGVSAFNFYTMYMLVGSYIVVGMHACICHYSCHTLCHYFCSHYTET